MASVVVQEFRVETNQALTALNDLENATIELATRADQAGNVVKNSFVKVRSGAAGATRGMRNMKGANTQINQLLLESGYVAQDAAFGFRGIANNIPGVVRAFNSARAAAGSTNALLSSLASSITGPAGVLFATNALVGILTVASMQFDIFSGSAEGASRSLEQIKKDLDLEGDLRVVTREVTRLDRALQGLAFAGRESARALLIGAQALSDITGFSDLIDFFSETIETNTTVTGNWIEAFRELNEQLQEFEELQAEAARELEQSMREHIQDLEVGGDLTTAFERAVQQVERSGIMQDMADALIPPRSVLSQRLSDSMSESIRQLRTGPQPLSALQADTTFADQISKDLSVAAREAGIVSEQMDKAGNTGNQAAQKIRAGFTLAAQAIQGAQNQSVEFERVLGQMLQTIGTIIGFANPAAGAAVAGSGTLLQAFEHGGTVRSPLQLVGESGPEIAALPRGTQVINNRETERIIERTGMGGSDRVVSELQAIERAVKQNRLAIDAFAFQEANRTTDKLLTDAGFPSNG